MTGKGLSWAEGLALWAYGVIMRALQPLLRRKLHRRGQQEPGYLAHMPERFGFYDGSPPEPDRVWVHAVSLGETRAAAILIGALRDVWPDMRLLLTHSTATGRAQGQSLLRPGDAQAWLPWDTPEATRQFLQHHRPRLGILMETEVWPMLVQACVQAQLPLVLANDRVVGSLLPGRYAQARLCAGDNMAGTADRADVVGVPKYQPVAVKAGEALYLQVSETGAGQFQLKQLDAALAAPGVQRGAKLRPRQATLAW